VRLVLDGRATERPVIRACRAHRLPLDDELRCRACRRACSSWLVIDEQGRALAGANLAGILWLAPQLDVRELRCRACRRACSSWLVIDEQGRALAGANLAGILWLAPQLDVRELLGRTLGY
jgi:hypothetical protein